MKTNKSYTKRLKVTKNGKILARVPGGNHFNAKESRVKKLGRRTKRSFNALSGKARGRFLPRTHAPKTRQPKTDD